jgi:hypothetical protein
MYKDDATTFEEVYLSGNICYCKFARERKKLSVNENCFEKKKMKNAIYYLRIDI